MLYIARGSRISDTLGNPARGAAGPASIVTAYDFYTFRNIGSRINLKDYFHTESYSGVKVVSCGMYMNSQNGSTGTAGHWRRYDGMCHISILEDKRIIAGSRTNS